MRQETRPKTLSTRFLTRTLWEDSSTFAKYVAYPASYVQRPYCKDSSDQQQLYRTANLSHASVAAQAVEWVAVDSMVDHLAVAMEVSVAWVVVAWEVACPLLRSTSPTFVHRQDLVNMSFR